jgi:integrase
MPIYRRGKTWWYAITLKGKTHRGSCRTENEQDAQELHDRLKAEIWRGRVIGDKVRRTVAEAIDRYLQEHEHKRSYADDQRIGLWWISKLSGQDIKFLDQVKPDVVRDIRDAEVGRVTNRGTIKPATVNRKVAFLRSVVNAAAKEWEWLESAPKFRLLTGEVERRRFLEPHEVLRLVKALPNPYSAMALFAVSTGLRRGNVLNLRWDQINLSKRVINFPGRLMKNGLPFTLALNDTAVEVLRTRAGKHKELVFCHEDGRPVSEIPSRTWAKATKSAGLEDLRWHDLRHTWASLLRQAGVGLDDLQELGGWESREMVQRYAHLNVEHLNPLAAKLDGVLSSSGPTVQISHSEAA